ncbi:MAG: heme peroxidase family protein [Actinomycetota bacterium]
MSQHHGIGDLYASALCTYGHERQHGDRFGRMFPELPALYTTPQVLRDIGRANGPMRAAANAAKTKKVAVGQVFFGQFIDHDITLDIESSVSRINEPSEIANARTPTLDLDCVYGSGPETQPYLYVSGDPTADPFVGAKMLVGGSGVLAGLDVQRNGEGVAMIGDFRNDENRIVSQIQLGMIKVHNKFCDEINGAEGLAGKELYEAARRATTFHYQWTVLHDFLPAMCGEHVVEDILCHGRRWYKPKYDDPFMPVEFSVAAYRFGHSMAPLRLQIRAGGAPQQLFNGNLGAFEPVADILEVVEWPEVFKIGGNTWQRAEKLDAKLASILLDLPFVNGPPEETSLATRNLRRGQSFLLPAGETVAEAMEVDPADIDKVTKAARKVHKALDGCTPLWLYCLLEGAVLGRGGKHADLGEGLGPVGGRIVAEVIIGLMECDSRSMLGSDRAWLPEADRETIGELLEWGAT